MSVADGTMDAIGHIFAASICNGGVAPSFLAPWVYKFMIGGIKTAISSCPETLSDESLYCEFYDKVSRRAKRAEKLGGPGGTPPGKFVCPSHLDCLKMLSKMFQRTSIVFFHEFLWLFLRISSFQIAHCLF